MQIFFKDNLSVSFGSGTSSSEDLNKERGGDRGRVDGVESVWRDVYEAGPNIDENKKNKADKENDKSYNNFLRDKLPNSSLQRDCNENNNDNNDNNNNNNNNTASNVKITAHL